jgi:hypothetical protein
MISCEIACRPGRFPTGIRSAHAGASSRSAGPISRSYTITSDARTASRPATVISRGSPGPAPTR